MKRGQFGFTTLIIFIALIATAAIAAGVILYTTGVLQQRAYRTGSSAIKKVSTGVEIYGVDGLQYDPSINKLNDKLSKVTVVDLWLRLRAGSSPVNLIQSTLVLVDEDEDGTYNINFKPILVPVAAKLKFSDNATFADEFYVVKGQNVNVNGYIDNCPGTITIVDIDEENYVVNLSSTGISLSSDILTNTTPVGIDCNNDNTTDYYLYLKSIDKNVPFPFILVGERISNVVYIRGLMSDTGIVDGRYYGLYWDPSDAYTDEEFIAEEAKVVKLIKGAGAEISTGVAMIVDNVRDLDQYLEEGETYEVLILFPYAIEGTGNYLAPEETYTITFVPKLGYSEYIAKDVPEVLNRARIRLYPYSE